MTQSQFILAKGTFVNLISDQKRPSPTRPGREHWPRQRKKQKGQNPWAASGLAGSRDKSRAHGPSLLIVSKRKLRVHVLVQKYGIFPKSSFKHSLNTISSSKFWTSKEMDNCWISVLLLFLKSVNIYVPWKIIFLNIWVKIFLSHSLLQSFVKILKTH